MSNEKKESGSRPPKRSGAGSLILKFLLIVLVVVPCARLYLRGQPIIWVVGKLLMFTNMREQTRQFWLKNVKIDTAVTYPSTPIAEVNAADFSMEALRHATSNWRYPAVVRGFFNGTKALNEWNDLEYLPSRLQGFTVPVVNDATVGTKQGDRLAMDFRDAFLDIVRDKSRRYLFFPVQSREHFNLTSYSTAKLQETINELVHEDLELDRIWPGFAGPKHDAYHGSQLIVGYGTASTKDTTGTGWHCAAGNNWFAQVVGRKRWYFMDQEYSPYMFPLRGGLVNMMTGRADMAKIIDHIPTRYVDLSAGDLLFNSAWEWHTIENYEGTSIGVPIREVNVSSTFGNNLHYSLVLSVNKFLKDRLNIMPGGFA